MVRKAFFQDYCDRCQNYCNMGERFSSTLNTIKPAGDLQPRISLCGEGRGVRGKLLIAEGKGRENSC